MERRGWGHQRDQGVHDCQPYLHRQRYLERVDNANHANANRRQRNVYPNGIAGANISLEARIVSIADVLDALASSRSYKKAWDDQRMQAYFLAQRGLQFDPDLVDILLANWKTVQALRHGNAPQNSSFGEFQ